MFPQSPAVSTTNWQEITERQLLKVTPDTLVTEVIFRMSQQYSSCVVIETEGKLEGIFTERDIVRLTASQTEISGIAIAEVMTKQPVTVSVQEELSIVELVRMLSRYSVRHLPLVNHADNTIGIITYRSLRNALKNSYLLKQKQVREVVNKQTIQAFGDRNITEIARLLATNQASCVVIVQPETDRKTIPIGIITERDVVQFRALGLNLEQTTACQAMSTPLLPIVNDASLWEAHQLMQQHRIRRLVVTNIDGSLAGTISQIEILQAVDIHHVYGCLGALESLVAEKNQQLEQTKRELENTVRQRTQELLTANKLLQQQINQYLSDDIWLYNKQTPPHQTTWLNKFKPLLEKKVTKLLKKFAQLQLPKWTGGAVSCLLAITIELMRRAGIMVPVPFMLLIITTTLSASLGGIVAGLWSSLVWAIFVIYAATVPFGPVTLTGGALQATMGIVALTLVAIVEGCAQEQNRRLTRMIRRVNCNLDLEVQNRTRELSTVNSYLRREIRDRIIAETKLKNSEAKYRAIFEQAEIGIVRAGLKGEFLAVNPYYCRMLGYTAKELSQLTFSKVTYPEDRATDRQNITQFLSGEISTLNREKRYVRKDGSVFWVNLTATLVKNEHHQPVYFIGVLEDIDRRKKAELALEASEERFFNTVNNFPFPVWISGEDGLCNFFNQAWLDFTGRTLAQELGYGWAEGVHPQDYQYVVDIYQNAFDKRENFSMEYRLKYSTGHYKWILDEGKPRFRADGSFAGYVGACIDISDRVKAKNEREQLLQNIEEKKQFLETVLQQMPAGVLIAKAPDGKIVLSNQQVEKILKHPLIPIEQIADYAQYGCLNTEGKPRQAEDYTLVKALQKRQKIVAEETQYLCGDGVVRSLLVNAAPVLNAEAEAIAAVTTFYDITELKQVQAIKKDAQQKALILKEINHRIKNNLQIISALLDLQSDQISDPHVIKLLEESQARIKTIALIHEKLYTSTTLDRIPFSDYVQALVSYLQGSFVAYSKQIQIDINIDSVELDIDYAIPCGLIINELIINALQHGFAQQQKGIIQISFKQCSENELCLIVKDNGIGIAEDIELDNIQSLGLNLVNSLVKTQLDGHLTIDRNQGTTFQIHFPWTVAVQEEATQNKLSFTV